MLKDGTLCDSKTEAIKYIEFKEKKLVFEHHKRYYIGTDRRRHLTYDFYFPSENKYVEVTSYNEENLSHIPGRYFKYLRKIVKKRQYVERVLNAKFEFVHFLPTQRQLEQLRDNIK
jgi:hypothetical protein